MDLALGLDAGDARLLARGGGHAGVQGHGELQGQEGRLVAGDVEESRVLRPGGRRAPNRTQHTDAGLPERAGPTPRMLPGIGGAVNDPTDPGLDEGLAAGRRLSVVVARLQRHVGRRALGFGKGALQGHDLRVGPAEHLVMPLAHHPPVPDQHAAHHGIRVDPAPAQTGELFGPLQVGPVGGREPGRVGHGARGGAFGGGAAGRAAGSGVAAPDGFTARAER